MSQVKTLIEDWLAPPGCMSVGHLYDGTPVALANNGQLAKLSEGQTVHPLRDYQHLFVVVQNDTVVGWIPRRERNP